MELLQGITATLRFPPADTDPVAFDAAPKVTVTDAGGAVLLNGETAAADGAFWEVKLAGSKILAPTLLSIVWAGKVASEETLATVSAEVVGGFVCSLASIENKLSEAREATELANAREAASQEVEELCGLGFRPRYVRELRGSRGSQRLSLPRRGVQHIVSIALEGDALTEAELDDLVLDPVGIITRAERGGWPEGHNNIDVAYIYGEPLAAAVAPVRDYAAWLLTEAPADWQGRATSFTNEFGVTYAVVTPGVRGAQTPIPSVNAFIERYKQVLV